MTNERISAAGDALSKKGLVRRIPQAYREQFASSRLQTNIGRMHAFSVYIIVIQILLNIINILKPADSKSSDIMIYVLLSMGTLLIGILYFILFLLIRKGVCRSRAVKLFAAQSLLYIYLIIQMTFCTLNVIATGGVNSYIIAILIVGLFPIIHPAQSIATIAAASVYLWVMMYLTRDISGAWDSILITDTWTNLIIITGLTICISVFLYNMYVENFLKSVQLQDINDHLESTVRERTAELETQTEAAQVASRAKSEFLARMSHEIRTPLNAIMGMTQIAKKTTLAPDTADALDEIAKASSHLLDVLNDVLDMSKIESGKFEMEHTPFDLKAGLQEAANIIAVRCQEKGITFINNVREAPAVWIVGDRLRLKQVLINLLGNAVKFTDNGGEISLRIAVEQRTDETITLRFVIADNGIGIEESQLSRLFTAFEQADANISARYGGTGLGLAISQSLVRHMGGEIRVKSAVGAGSEFSFTIQVEIAQSQNAREAVENESQQVPDFSGQRILLVEDIEINRVIVSSLLMETNVLMEEAADGMAAVNMFTASPEGYYSLILMDIQMPNMDGYDATRRIRAAERRDAATIPIIAMTANAYKEDIERCIEAGMNDHLSKPVDFGQMIRVLSSIMH